MVTYLVADGQLDVTIANAKFEAQLLAEHTPFAATPIYARQDGPFLRARRFLCQAL